MRSHEIRERFLRFFEERGHVRLPSAPLIPHDDPSILFTVAGMVPLKPYIAGLRTPPSPRLVSCQKCFRGGVLRYDDIASSGDATHNTFFEMLGNWSIGDYFKQGAIDLAWELATGVFGLDPQRIWVSVFPDDAASALLWTDRIGVPRERVVELTENWWAAGPTGPCGYDSEMYWDDGGPCSCGRTACTPADDCGGDRWVEFWNLVFMEFDQQEDGSRPLLPKPTVDTGMGLERVTRILQGVRSIFATDLFVPLIENFRLRAGRPEPARETTRSFNVLADHLRGAAFLIADGVLPGNEGRGYVLRRLIRRAAVHARRVELRGGLADGVPVAVELMGSVYPELTATGRLIEETLRGEEAVFTRTLEAASRRFEALAGDGGRISGEDAFRLYDTYGLPIELTVEMAAERGADVDMAGFTSAMAAQREQSRSSVARAGFGGESLPGTRFVGYDVLATPATVLRIGAAGPRDVLAAGESSEVVLDASPFYAEAGGQIGDSGWLTWTGGRARVIDTTYATGGARLQHVRVDEGALRTGDQVDALVDAERRAQTARHHSATHLLNRALRGVFGDAVVQRGSLVTPDHTTFDFSFPRALEPDELTELEHLVNDAVRRDLVRTAEEMPLSAARASGAVALLDETYGDLVRVIDFGGWSRELCGGTHVERTGEIGAVIIAAESSIGQGKRRIDMVAGEAAEERWRDLGRALQTAGRALRVPGEQVPERVSALQDQVRKLTRELDAARRGGGGAAGLGAATLEDVSGIKLAHLMLDPDQADGVREAADRLFAERLQGDGVAAVLGATAMAVKVGGRALEAGLNAGALVSAASAATGAAGGGRRDFASGGVKDPAKRHAALGTIRAAVEEAALAGFEGRG
ncbi:MAG TPA: alanine--tRNA ligase [Candidatus Dormibacteraeota bacterium]